MSEVKEKFFTVADILEQVADDAPNLRRKDLEAVFKVIAHALVSGERVKLTKIGTIWAQEFAGRTSRNPQTGEPIEVGPTRRLRIKATKALKEALSV